MGIIMPEQGIEPAAPSRCQRPEIRALVILLIGLAGKSGFTLVHPAAEAAVTYDENTGDLAPSKIVDKNKLEMRAYSVFLKVLSFDSKSTLEYCIKLRND